MTAVLAAAALLVAVLLALELLLRGMGFGSFPLYEAHDRSVYRMRPAQAGCFRRRFAWRYDANGMRNDETPPSFAETTLLVGDSVVDGGLGCDQSQTLAAQASRLSGQGFYSVACHGWALANCLPALTELPGWTDAKRLVFILNTGDLDTVGTMGSELSFPTRRPLWLTLWIARRQAYRRVAFFRRTLAVPELPGGRKPDLRAANLAAFGKLLGDYAGAIFLVRYPLRDDDARTERYFEQLTALDPRIRFLDVADAAEWTDDCYVDHIHPNAEGVEVLAHHLCRKLS